MDLDDPRDTGLDAVKTHQAHHCKQIGALAEEIVNITLAIQLLTAVLIRKGVVTPADLYAEAKAVDGEGTTNEETH